MSQNILSTLEGFATWGWNRSEGSVFKATLRYYGLGVNLWLSGTYGGNQQLYTVAAYNPESGKLEYPSKPILGRYYSITAGASLPLLMQRGYHTRQLTLGATWNFSNGMVANVDKLIFEGGKVTSNKSEELFCFEDSEADIKLVTIKDNASRPLYVDNGNKVVTMVGCTFGNNTPANATDVKDVEVEEEETLIFLDCTLGDTTVDDEDYVKVIYSGVEKENALIKPNHLSIL